jgi:endoglucanase
MNILHSHVFKRSLMILFALFICLALALLSQGASLVSHASGSAYVRVNQVGYLKSDTKQAILMASGLESGATFSVMNTSNGKVVYSASIGASQGNWSKAFPNTYLLDFSSVRAAGNYKITVKGSIDAISPVFSIGTGADLYSRLLPNALFFYQAQHDGPNVNPNVMNRQPSHLTDEQASIYDTPVYKNDVLQADLKKIGGPIDVSGGWFDAGDYIKLVQTASPRCKV